MRSWAKTLHPGGLVLAGCLWGCLWGCLGESETGLSSRDPSERFTAIVAAAGTQDRKAIPGLISRLDSEDPAERLLAIQALKRLTGLDHGYEHAGSDADRRAAAERWTAWAKEQGLAPVPKGTHAGKWP